MKRFLRKYPLFCRTLCALIASAAFTLALPSAEAGAPVLIDSDMTELFDDGIAMIMLERAPETELLGISVATGNAWVEDGTAFALRQLEGLEVTDVPVAMGQPFPYMLERFRDIDRETRLFGRGHDAYNGAAGYDRPKDWQTAYRRWYKEAPTLTPVDEPAEDFIIRNLKEHPGEVTILAIGPCTNLAKAVEKAPEIVPLAKRIVYMGGAFFQQGNVTPAAEFNIWIDPQSAKEVMRAPWAEQIIVPLDACEKVRMTPERFRQYQESIEKPLFAEMMARHYLAEYLASGAGPVFLWDVLAAALIIDPTVITEEITLPVDVNDVRSPSFGQTLAYLGAAPEGTQKARIVRAVDQERIFAMIGEVFRGL